MIQKKIGFLGFGHMAQIIFSALIKANLIHYSQVSFFRRDLAKSAQNQRDFGIASVSLKQLIEDSDILFLCVRPQQFCELSESLPTFDFSGKLVISVLGGTTLSTLEKGFGCDVCLIRSMPNIASEVGQGMTILSYASSCDPTSKELAVELFESMGQVSVLPESMMDVACGMAGSGPGFVLRLIEAMAEAGKKQGMQDADALKIAAQTFLGAASLVLNGSKPSTLLKQIATPQGTTAAGFESMNQTEIDVHFTLAVEAAAKRSKQLSAPA